MATVLLHCFNEEYMLPWWLNHHKKIFDHGIIIDYGSTDRTVSLCHELAPTWEVRPSRNEYFDAELCDKEMMDIEKEVQGWKCTLNVTEFFCCPDIKAFIKTLEEKDIHAAGIRAVLMADSEDVVYPEPTYDSPLAAQRFHGYFEDAFYNHARYVQRSRLFHNHPHGDYFAGRHLSKLDRLMHPSGALLLWFGWSPWNERIIARRLQIGSKLSPQDKAWSKKSHHLWTPQELMANYSFAAKPATDMRAYPDYRRIVGVSQGNAPSYEEKPSPLADFFVHGIWAQRASLTINESTLP